MGIDVAGGADLGVAEVVRDNDQRRPIGDHKAGIGVPERVDVHIRKAVALHELMKPLRDRNQPFFRAIEKYGWDNFRHIIIASDLTEMEAKEMEKDLIAL